MPDLRESLEVTFSGTDEEWEAEQERTVCRVRPSKRSSARCEMPKGHTAEDNEFTAKFHAGRTQGGYWKFWPAEKPAVAEGGGDGGQP